MSGAEDEAPLEHWRSLRFFCAYRLVIAGLLLISVVRYGDLISIGRQNLKLYLTVGEFYLAAAAIFLVLTFRSRARFTLLLTIQVLCDILCLTLMLHASGGQVSGMAGLVLIVIAGAGLVGQGRMTLFYAATASLAMLVEQTLQTLRFGAEIGEFFRTGLVCAGFFGIGITARLLARRVLENEQLAQARGRALDKQLAVNDRIIADMADGVLVVEPSGRVRQANHAAQRMLGTQVGQGNLRDWSGYLYQRIALHQAGGGELIDSVRLDNGQAVRLRLKQGATVGDDAIVYVEDVERIKRQAQQLKLAALGRLTANLAHEVRNPLAAISHAAELLAEDEADPQRLRLATIIASNAERLNRLVGEVLEIGRRDRAVREEIDWNVFVRTFMDELVLHDPGAAERVVVFGENARLFFDRGHLYRVLWNLLLNALRHASGARGAIRMSLHLAALGVAEIDVIDDGPGIDEELAEQVFEPFYTSHGSGTGLGLFMARELCEANGANLHLVRRTKAEGAHFRITVETR